MQATWVGHSTLLVQLEGLTFLTDPIFSQRCRQGAWQMTVESQLATLLGRMG